MRKWKQTVKYIGFFLAAVMLCCCFFGGAAAHAAEAEAAEEAEETRTVRIPCGINSLLYLDEDGQLAGYCSEYMEELAKINNWEYVYVETTWTEALTMLETGEIDLLFPVSLTPEHMETMDFSTMIGGYTASGLFAREDSDYVYGDYEGFDGARIAVTENSSNADAMAAFAREHGFSYTPVYLETTQEKKQALADGTVDMILFSAANEIPGAKQVSLLDAEPVYYVVKKGNTELLTQLENGMQELLIRKPGLVAQTYSGCMVGSNNENRIAFNAEEQDLIAAGTEVVVGFYRDTEPLAYVDSDGEYNGIYVELMELVHEKTNLNISLYPIDRGLYWKDLVADGTIDFYIGASDAADMQAEGFRMTSSFMDYETVMVTRNDYELYKDSKPTIALTGARAYLEQKLLANFADGETVYYKTAKECLLAVKHGEADATLLNKAEYNYQSKNVRFSNLVQWTNYQLKSGTVLVATDSLDPILFSTMEKALTSLSESKTDEVVNANLNISYQTMDIMDYIYSARYFLITIAAVLATGIVVGIILRKNRSRQRKLQQEVQEREKEQLRTMAALSMDYASVYYVNLDEDLYTIVEITDKLRREVADMAKQSRVFSEAMLQYIDLFVSPEYQENIRQMIQREALIERFREGRDFVIRYQVKPNAQNQKFFEMHFVDVSEGRDEHIMVLGFRCVDDIAQEEIAQKKALQEAYEAANSASNAKSDFLSKMSHDIRTPMNAIVGMTAIAAAHLDDRERVEDALGKITSSSRHLLALINEVLDMSKIESGKIDLAEEEFNLPELIDNLLQMMQPQLAQHGHHLEVHVFDIRHENVVGDSLRLQQVFVNIMGNAVKYTPDNGNICLSVREKSITKNQYGCYEFVFEDDGIGMPEEFLEHIFEPFSRVEDVRTSRVQGTGLGMAIARNIVRMMNGDIQIESEIGKGSKFTVTIFLKLQDMQDVRLEELKGLPILVVDDDRISCETVCHMLEEIGMNGEWVLSGREAVARVEEAYRQEKEFYAVVLDWKMPEMDGVETAREIRRIVKEDVPLVILSAYDWSDIEMEAREAGIDAFLSKPVFKSGLVRLFKNLKTGTVGRENVKHMLDGMMDSDYTGRRALLVEDNELNREIAAEILGVTGMQIDTAENGKEALDKFAASAIGYYDIIFMDVQMPVMNGYEATVEIRSLERADASDIPIIAMTANAFSEDVQIAKNSGMNEHLAKPLDFDRLAVVMKQYLKDNVNRE